MSLPGSGCGCGNPWNGSVEAICGTFETPLVEDQGRCSPHQTKIESGAPSLPVSQCDDDQFTIIDNPLFDPPFLVIARLFDQTCSVFTDQNGNPITIVLAGVQ